MTEASDAADHDLIAVRYADGSLSCPPHPRGPGGSEVVDRIDLSDRVAEVVTWTESHATPPGVREPNPIAIVEFDLDAGRVRTIGQLTTADVAIGDAVRPVPADDLRDPEAGVREPASQSWDGFRFEPAA
jgi:uncharacterized OB-fold protein